jgi:hypothetical protein
MVIPTGRQKRSGIAETLHDLESEHARIEANRAFKISDF